MTPDEVVAGARLWLGTPYRHRAATLGAGCDCLGLLRGVFGVAGELPIYSARWRDDDGRQELAALARRFLRPAPGPAAGLVALFRLGATAWPRHCGIFVGPDRFIHAQEGLGVVEASLGDGWRRRLAGSFSFSLQPGD